MNKTNVIFRVTAWWAGLYHLALGVIGVFSDKDQAAAVIKTVFRANVEITPQVSYLVKFCSAYMIAFAVAMIILGMNPVQYRNLVWIPLTLFTIRLLERVAFSSVLANSFGIPAREEMVTSIILVAMIFLLFFFRPKKSIQVL